MYNGSMEMYWFERDKISDEQLLTIDSELKDSGFYGVMYPYGPSMGDYFTRVARIMDPDSDFKYLIAVRPYNMSPQYLSMIYSSMNNISDNKIEVNLLTGYLSDKEKAYGGTLLSVNDHSSNIERSNYMINYAKELKNISDINFFVSATNKEVFELCTENELPMIVPHFRTKEDWFILTGQKILLMIEPVITETLDAEWKCDNENECRHPKDAECAYLDFFTEEKFLNFLRDCESKGIYGILFQESVYIEKQYKNILPLVKSYLENKQ